MRELKKRYDCAVIGGGIAGMQAALDLAEQGFQVLLVEQYASIGGIMVGLNKVFPTLDCSSCICTPRMAETAHHPNITVLTYCDVEGVDRSGQEFSVKLVRKPRYVVEEDCVGCSKCELACPIDVPHEFEYGIGARRAIYIAHANAIPQVPVLDTEHCTFCGKCADVCPKHCIDYLMEERRETVSARTVVLATGLKLTPMDAKEEYGGGRLPNVMNPLAMERAQSSNGPYGQMLRPSDGKIPRRIAYVQCAGSRDQSIGVRYCSRVCCMYALKQALLLTHYIHGLEVTIYHMDIRAFGKGYEQFYRRVISEGVRIVKGKVARITEDAEHNLTVRVEEVETGKVLEEQYDLVVLSQGLRPAWDPAVPPPAALDSDGFFKRGSLKLRPALSSIPGLFIAGVATGPKDIPDSIVEAGSAAMEAAIYLHQQTADVPLSRYAS